MVNGPFIEGIEGCIDKTGRLNMLEWFLLTSYSVPLTSVITLATLVLTTVIVFRLFSKRQVNDFGNKFVVITGCDTGFGHEKAILLDKNGSSCVGDLSDKGRATKFEIRDERQA